MAAAVLAFCIFAIPSISKGVGIEYSQLASLKYPILIGGYLSAIPFFIALYQAFRLLGYIDKNAAFSPLSVRALTYIKYCGIAMSILYVAGLPLVVLPVAEADDAPGLVVLGMLIAAAPIVVAVFAAILQKLAQNAIAIKSENDLVV